MQHVSQGPIPALQIALHVHEAGVGEIILQQLGGRRFGLMTGAKNFVTMADGLHFDVPRMSTKNGNISRVTIRLRGDDTYTMAFTQWKPAQLDFKLIGVVSHLQAEQLRDIFTLHTGLYVG